MRIFEGLEKDMAPDSTHSSPVDFLMVVGDGRDDEVIFRWANELEKEKTVKNVTTVSLGSRNTEAGYTLTQGVTGKHRHFPTWCERFTNNHLGVLTVLQKLAQLS
jgi:trehalose 6-phosphate synthase complex regulatory subunit